MSLWHPYRPFTLKEMAEAINLFGKTQIPSNCFASGALALPALPNATLSYNSMVLWRNRFLFMLAGNNTAYFYCLDIERGVIRSASLAMANIYIGSLVGVHQDRYLYTCCGNAYDYFGRYDIYTNTWASMASLPSTVTDTGGGACYDGERYIYLVRGMSTTSFYRYDCINNTWATLASLPAAVYNPSNLVKVGNYLYLLAGNNTSIFYRYDIANNTWSTLASAPNTTDRGALAWDGADYIYALRGAGSTDFWRYKISTNTWETLTPTPAPTSGGGLAYYVSPVLGAVIFVRRGNNTTDLWLYKV
jgi:hypothetical protein